MWSFWSFYLLFTALCLEIFLACFPRQPNLIVVLVWEPKICSLSISMVYKTFLFLSLWKRKTAKQRLLFKTFLETKKKQPFCRENPFFPKEKVRKKEENFVSLLVTYLQRNIIPVNVVLFFKERAHLGKKWAEIKKINHALKCS